MKNDGKGEFDVPDLRQHDAAFREGYEGLRLGTSQLEQDLIDCGRREVLDNGTVEVHVHPDSYATYRKLMAGLMRCFNAGTPSFIDGFLESTTDRFVLPHRVAIVLVKGDDSDYKSAVLDQAEAA